jgi:uncharacterized protein YjbI with pentapeptide repeats
VLSCLAALQAPVIMMSQNRQEEKDRERAKKDYMINLKAELELRIMHEKLDHLTQRQALATQQLTEALQAGFEDAILEEAILTNANLMRANFTGANLARAQLDGSSLYEAIFRDTQLEGASWRDANIKKTRLALR